MIVSEEAKPGVARAAEQAAHPAGGVTVIDKKRFGGGLFAHRTYPACLASMASYWSLDIP
jgi:hypothetical protein